MQIGINDGASTSAASRAQFNIVLPPAKKDASATSDPFTARPSVKISISPEANAMLSIDAKSLAEQGYGSVELDVDGKPGADIVIGLSETPDASGSYVSGTLIAADLGATVSNNDAATSKDPLDILLKALAAAAADPNATKETDNEKLQKLLAELEKSSKSLLDILNAEVDADTTGTDTANSAAPASAVDEPVSA
jgi:hypothetical protein